MLLHKDSDLVAGQIALEKKMTQCSIDNYRRELNKLKDNGQFSNSSVATKLLSRVLDNYSEAISKYLEDYSKGKAVRSTMAAETIERLKPFYSEEEIKTEVSFTKKLSMKFTDYRNKEYKNINIDRVDIE